MVISECFAPDFHNFCVFVELLEVVKQAIKGPGCDLSAFLRSFIEENL